MAKAHVLDSSGALTRVVWHFTLPAGNNEAGIPWTTALKNSGLGGTTVLPDGTGTGGTISAAEKNDIADGEVMEVVESIDLPPGMNAATANAFLDAAHAAKQTEVFELLQRQLRYAGYTRA